MEVDLYGYRVKVADLKVNEYVFQNCDKGKWKPELYALLRAELRPGMLFIDIGAYVGSVTLFAAAMGNMVRAVECDPTSAAAMRENVSLNPELAMRVKVLECAVAEQRGHVQFGARGGLGSSVGGLNFLNDEGRGDLEVKALELGDLVPYGPYFIKLNVQGAEGRILWAARETIKRDLPPLHVYVRPLNWCEKRENWQALIDALKLYPSVRFETGEPLDPEDIGKEPLLSRKDYKIFASRD